MVVMRKTYLTSVFLFLVGVSPVLAQTPAPAQSLGAVAPVQHNSPSYPYPVLAPSIDAPAPVTGTLPGDAAPCPPSCCIPDVQDGKGPCGPPGRFWISAEYLLWWTKGDPVPPLVTTGPATFPPPGGPQPGALGTPGTVVLFGGNDINSGPSSGARISAGFWLNDCHTWGIEGSYFFLGPTANVFAVSSSGGPGSIVLARPFFDVSTGLQNAELDAFPGLASGSKTVSSNSFFQSPELNLIRNLLCSCQPCDCCQPCETRQPVVRGYRVDLIAGPRFLFLNEQLRISETTSLIPGVLPGTFDGATINAFDEFDTSNQFYGAQVGARAEVWRNRWFANITGKCAFGVIHQTVDINGGTRITSPTGAILLVAPGDLLALPSNIGHYERAVFSVVPEANVTLGYQLTERLRIFAGYTFLYWSGVERPGDAIDFNVNSTRVPTALPLFGIPPTGPLAPLFTWHPSGIWAMGINVGAQLRF